MNEFRTTIDDTPIVITPEMLQRYNHAGPRYTSYPTAPQWNDAITSEEYEHILMESNSSGKDLSLYMHIPFCEEQCTFCGCSTVITKKKEIAEPYLAALQQELYLLDHHLDSSRHVSQLHWGGGTPTYLSCAQIEALWATITKYFKFRGDAEISIEVDPRVTTKEHLRTLRTCGFNRISLGVQDLDPRVQEAVNRIQPMHMTQSLIEEARALGFDSVNVDLIYGLPHQTQDGFAKTTQQIIDLDPDRIACFSFAYVPWMKAQQRNIPEDTLPDADDKLRTWCATIEQFGSAGYTMIGFDHFAKSGDELTKALHTKSLRRNFQGYSTQAGADMVACGMTGIGDIHGHYVQNEKKVPRYQNAVHAQEFPIVRGCRLSNDDLIRREFIQHLLCNNHIDLQKFGNTQGIDCTEYFSDAWTALAPMQNDGLVDFDTSSLHITPQGRLFARNVAMCFDAYRTQDAEKGQKYSQTV